MTLNLEGILKTERLAVSRALSFVENNPDPGVDLLDDLIAHIGHAYRVGITGPPGAGKSSLVDQLILRLREREQRVAVLSVDPTSPFTGGAILGDRVRMTRHYKDSGVFIRSMATRGSLGGLALQAQDAADVLDAAGYDVILFETVGVGQVELDVAEAADTTVVVLVPESGDDIQAMKSGLMEIADLFVINKADRQGANQAQAQLKSMLEMRPRGQDHWNHGVIKTVAPQGEGIADLITSLDAHHAYLKAGDHLRANLQRRLVLKIRTVMNAQLHREFWTPEREAYLESQIRDSGDALPKPGAILDHLRAM